MKENENELSAISEEENEEKNQKITNYIPPSQVALPFVIFSDNKFIIPEEARKLLCQQKYNNSNIGIISLVGKYRTGKSFLLNRVLLNLRQNPGFGVGPTFKPCTKGIWIWSDPIMVSNIHSKNPFPVFLIDTEGLGAYDEEINHDSKIFLIAILISSLFIFNSFGAIDENAINSLSFVLNLSKTIKIKSVNKEDKEEELAEYFPTLLWLLRDFSLKLEDKDGNTITEKQYLENALEDLAGTSDVIEEKNRVRSLIRSYFKEKDLFVMVRPVEEESDLQNLQNLPDEKLRKEFLEQSKFFRNKVMKKIKPKIFKKKNLNGFMLVELVQSILDAINTGSIPVIENSWKYIMQNECIKNGNEIIKKFVKDIVNYREKNKNKSDFFISVKKYSRKAAQAYLNEFMKNNIVDEENKKEFSENLQKKINIELNKFDKENEKIFEEKFNKELNILANNFMSTISNNEKYSKNYYQFFQDFENFKDEANKLTPDFPHKSEILFDKIILIIRKFIDDQIIKIKLANEKIMIQMKMENNKNKQKINELNEVINKNNEYINKLNNENINSKKKYKNIEQEMNKLLNTKKNDNVNYQKNLDKLKKEYENKIKELSSIKIRLENDLKNKENELLISKMNNDKISSLNEQKILFLDKEINSLKEKNNSVVKQSKTKEENLYKEIKALKDQIKNIISEKDNKENINTDEVNNNLNNLMNYFKDHLKAQNEENKNMLEKMIKEKEKNEGDKELFKNYKEITQKNSDLALGLNIRDNKIKNLENQLNKLNEYKEIINHAIGFKCKYCNKIYTFEIFKKHYNNCQRGIIDNTTSFIDNNINNNLNNETISKMNLNIDKLKIKILKGSIKQDELGKPYLEYILDINYNTQNWRINKRFTQFATLYKTIKNLFKGIVQMPLSSKIFVSFTGRLNRAFHKNKIQQLEMFIKDLSEIEVINSCKPFRKFLEFEKNVDDENEILINISQRQQINNNISINNSNNINRFNNNFNGNNENKFDNNENEKCDK